jgi:hypothetical protein
MKPDLLVTNGLNGEMLDVLKEAILDKVATAANRRNAQMTKRKRGKK